MAITGVKNNASTKRIAVTRAVSPVRPPCSTPAVLSMKLVTVLVPKAAPTTVPRASDRNAWLARGSLSSLMNPARSATPTRVPSVSNTTMKRKINTKGIIGHETARTTSIFSSVLSIEGGCETNSRAIWNFCIRSDRATNSDWPIESAALRIPSCRPTARSVAARMPQKIAPRTPSAISPAVTSKPKKKMIRSGEAKCGFKLGPAGEKWTRPAVFMPITAMNSPMPTAIALRRLGLMVSRST